jgi:hypothetical protein
MNLFNKEKDLIFKIANLILLVLLMAFMTGFWVKLMEVIIPERTLTYKDFKQTYCDYGYTGSIDMEYNVTPSKAEYTDKECKDFYKNQMSYMEDQKYEDKKQLFISLGNALIVSFAIFILNGKKA